MGNSCTGADDHVSLFPSCLPSYTYLSARQKRLQDSTRPAVCHTEQAQQGLMQHVFGETYHGMICPITPSGSLRVYACNFPSVGIVWPAGRLRQCLWHCQVVVKHRNLDPGIKGSNPFFPVCVLYSTQASRGSCSLHQLRLTARRIHCEAVKHAALHVGTFSLYHWQST